MIRKLTVLAALLAVTTPAAAITVISNTPGAPDPGVPAGLTTVATFDAPLATGVVNTFAPSTFTGTGSVLGEYAAPAGNGTTNAYQAVRFNGFSLFDFSGYTGGAPLGKFSLYWGSIDRYNTLTFLRADNSVAGSFTGVDFPPSSGNQTAPFTNRRITFGFSSVDAVTKVKFTSSENAFEYDTLAVAGVPEPATWAMMILGFGLIGGALRSRKAATVRFATA